MTLETTGNVRSSSETNFSPRKETKKMRCVAETVAEEALEGATLKDMLKDQGPLLASMTAYVEELTENKVTEKDPRRLLKMLLMGGYMDEEGLVTNNENEKSLIWKDVKRFNASQSMNLINNHNLILHEGSSVFHFSKVPT